MRHECAPAHSYLIPHASYLIDISGVSDLMFMPLD